MASGKISNGISLREVPHSHWGEFITPSPSSSSSTSSKAISVLDIEAPTLKPKTIVIDPPRPHQPSTQQKTNRLQPLPAELCRPDQLSLNTIQLLKQNTRIRCAMVQYPNDPSKYDDKSNVPLLSTPPLPTPERKFSSELEALATGSLSKIAVTDGTVEIDSSVARQLGRRAVATICAHAGFELIQESSLETITDVLHEYHMKVCKLLRAAVDREALTGHTGFQDVLAQVLQEIGVGSTETLYNFWKVRVKGYNAVIQRRNAQLKERFESKRNPSTSSIGEDSKSPRVKEEPFSDIQFPESDQDHEETKGSTSESQSQPLPFHSLELDEAARAASNIPGEPEGQWPYMKSEPTENASQSEESKNVGESSAASEQNEDESAGSFVSESPSIVDIDVTSPPKNTPSQELASPPPPKKKRKKSGGTSS